MTSSSSVCTTFCLRLNLRSWEESGIQIEHVKSIQYAEIVDVDLFEGDILQEARKMADFYALYYSLENSIRRLISERLIPETRGQMVEGKCSRGSSEGSRKRSRKMRRIQPCRSVRKILLHTRTSEN